MQSWEQIAEARTPGGEELTLVRRGQELVIRVAGKLLMSNRMHASEEALAPLGCARARELPRPCVLVGGLGMGFTLRATLDLLPREAIVVVSELVPALVEWNRGPLAAQAGRPLDDPRVRVEVGDVRETLRAGTGRFDAVLLDVDNGPEAFTERGNHRLYTPDGLAMARTALRPEGVLAIWSVSADRGFERRLARAGLSVETRTVRGRDGKNAPRHTIFLGRAPRD